MKVSRLVPVVMVFALGSAACGSKKENAPSEPPAGGNAMAASSPPAAATSGGKSAMALPVLGPAPSWQLRDVDGNAVSSDEFKGKVVVLDFWATWCPPCRVEIPGYIELQKRRAKDGLVIVGVSLDQEGPGVVKKFMAEQGINYPVVMGDEKIIEAFGGVEGIPTTFIIDREGRIRHRKVGAMRTREYEAVLERVL